jgi:hypothetical protein
MSDDGDVSATGPDYARYLSEVPSRAPFGYDGDLGAGHFR